MKRLLPIIILVVLSGLGIKIITLAPRVDNNPRGERRLRVHFIDVGQGDCILLQTPDGRNMLVDAGDEGSTDDVVAYLAKCNVNRLDLLVITHPHSDHIGGLPGVLEEFGVSKVLDIGYPHGSRTYREVLSAIDARRVDYRLAGKSPVPQISKDVDLQVVWPVEDGPAQNESDLNDSSIVLRATYGDVSVLLAADIEAAAEGRLLATRQDLRSTILKVAHHGGKESTSNEFLQVVRPEFAVISVGSGNAYGHPSRSVIRRLSAMGAKIYRTDLHGSTIISTDGELVEVETER